LIGRCGIDILVDLNAYSTPQRLGLWLDPPAPITVAWFNAYATTALPGVQAIVGDAEVVRVGEEAFYTESVRRLPLSYLTFDVRHPAPPVVPPPCCTQGVFTFGSLVAQYKITPAVLDAWAAILRGAPAAHLLLANTALKSLQNREYVRQQFDRRGISADRLQLLGPAEHYAYLQYYDQIDAALDAFPYNGGTTTMEALWQGVPVLTFSGDRWASRTSASLIRHTHLDRFAAASLDAFVQQAIQLATSRRSPVLLAELRQTMRGQLASAAACDTRRLAAAMEAIYRQLDREREQGR
jgi:predicted O-linked N-acetylglucosamine transferase (SPINDLY family)